MHRYNYFWDGSYWDIYAKDIEEAQQLVFDLDRIPYDIIHIPTLNINMEVVDEDKKDTAAKSQKDIKSNSKKNASKATGYETYRLKSASI